MPDVGAEHTWHQLGHGDVRVAVRAAGQVEGLGVDTGAGGGPPLGAVHDLAPQSAQSGEPPGP